MTFANRMSGTEQSFLKKNRTHPHVSRYALMRATFDDTGGGSWAQPTNPARGSPWRLAWWGVIFVMAFGWGMAIAAAYEALCEQQARGVMDRAW